MFLELSPERFLQIVVLGLYWEHSELVWYKTSAGNNAVRKGFTTVNHILKVFSTLGKISQQQVESLIQNRRTGLAHQRYLQRYTGTTSAGRRMGNNLSLIYARVRDHIRPLNLLALVTTTQIEISAEGISRAKEYERVFQELGITKDQYLTKVREIQAMFQSEAASAAASAKYRERMRTIQEET